MKYADGLVLLAKVLQGVTEGLNGIERYYGKEVNVDVTSMLRIPKQPSAVQILIDQNKWIMWSIVTISVAR